MDVENFKTNIKKKDSYIKIDSFEEYLWVHEYGSMDRKVEVWMESLEEKEDDQVESQLDILNAIGYLSGKDIVGKFNEMNVHNELIGFCGLKK